MESVYKKGCGPQGLGAPKSVNKKKGPKCWKGYKAVGKKKSPSGKKTKGGKAKMVNNCVKIKK
jgi:hypothetical protein|tara:strand:+ start:94 stop:282 length:189 start_codon:yes stop_codon:yes gene_type:complete